MADDDCRRVTSPCPQGKKHTLAGYIGATPIRFPGSRTARLALPDRDRLAGMLVFETPFPVSSLPSHPGSYILELHLERALTVRAGKLGPISLGPGRVRYYGSARGPGGVRARVARHLRSKKRRSHWHIDALTLQIEVARVLVTHDLDECTLVQRDLGSGDWQVAAPGFGSSDCRTCAAHLLAPAVHVDAINSRTAVANSGPASSCRK